MENGPGHRRSMLIFILYGWKYKGRRAARRSFASHGQMPIVSINGLAAAL